MDRPVIRLIEKKDIPFCTELAIKCFNMQLTNVELKAMEREFKLSFKNYPQKPKMFVATIDEKIVGMAGYSQSMMDWETYEFFWLCVDPEYRNIGVAALLTKTRESDIMERTPQGDSITIIFSCLNSLIPYHKSNGYEIFIEKAGDQEVVMGKTFLNV